jgi:hypothetical protein
MYIVGRLYESRTLEEKPELLQKDHHGIIARRTLYALRDAKDDLQRRRVWSAQLYLLSKRDVLREILSWYPLEESANLRLFVLQSIPKYCVRGSEEAKISDGIAEIGMKDWDARCVAAAKLIKETYVQPAEP